MPIVRKYLAEVSDISNPVEGLYTLSFYSEKGFKYLPGQFLHLALDEYDGIGQWPESRCFSMQSSPSEQKIKISYSVKGVFTQRMEREIHKGKIIWLKLPYGDIFQRSVPKNKSVFIAGGTGITPFLSLFKDESFIEYNNPNIYLGFRAQEYNIYEEDLKLCKNPYANFHLIYQNEKGILDIDKIYSENGNGVYYLSGPPLMLKTFKVKLREFGIPDNYIITDDWE